MHPKKTETARAVVVIVQNKRLKKLFIGVHTGINRPLCERCFFIYFFTNQVYTYVGRDNMKNTGIPKRFDIKNSKFDCALLENVS